MHRLLAVVRELENVSLAIVGDGPLRGELEHAFAGIPTTFLGLLRGRELAAAFASADLFIFPSDSETLGLVMLEAHASGLPVIAPDCGSAQELVRHGTDGVRYDPHDPAALTTAVALLADATASNRAMMGLQGRHGVEGATWREATHRLREIYRAACDERPRSRTSGRAIQECSQRPAPSPRGTPGGRAALRAGAPARGLPLAGNGGAPVRTGARGRSWKMVATLDIPEISP